MIGVSGIEPYLEPNEQWSKSAQVKNVMDTLELECSRSAFLILLRDRYTNDMSIFQANRSPTSYVTAFSPLEGTLSKRRAGSLNLKPPRRTIVLRSRKRTTRYDAQVRVAI